MANSVGGGTWLRRSCFWRMQGSGVMGRSLPSSPRATWLTLDFPARCAAGSRMPPQEECPCSGPCSSTQAWPPAVPTVHAPLLCASPCLPPGPLCPERTGSPPSLSTPTTKTASPRHPAPCTPAHRMSPGRAGSPLLCSALGPAGRAGVLAPTAGLGLAQRGPSPRKRSGAGPSHTRTEGGPAASGHGPPSPAPCQAG